MSGIFADNLKQPKISEQSISYTSHEIPDMPNIVVGMDNRINAVKQILLQNDVDRLGITRMGGGIEQPPLQTIDERNGWKN